MVLSENRVLCVKELWICLAATVFVIFTVATSSVAASDGSRRTVFPILLGVPGVVLTTAAGIQHKIHNRRVNIHVDVGLWLQISSAVALGVTLLIRLLAVKHFGGAVVDLNAGVKGESNTSNLAFTSEANTVGHILQGGLVVFLFPLHQNAIFGSFSALGLLVYPVYNFVKRLRKSREYFAVSSYWNNASEWMYGVVVGVCLGLMLVSWLQWCTRAAQGPRTMPRWVWWIRCIAGFVQTAAILAASFAMGITWNNVPNRSRDDPVGQASVIAVPIVVQAALHGVYFTHVPMAPPTTHSIEKRPSTAGSSSTAAPMGPTCAELQVTLL